MFDDDDVIYRNEINKAIRCVGNQLAQCRLGGKKNTLDSFKLPFFNSKVSFTKIVTTKVQLLLKKLNFEQICNLFSQTSYSRMDWFICGRSC